MSAVLLSLSVMSLLLPTAFHASWADQNDANKATLKVSRGTSVILLIIYVLYLLFQLKSHAYLYESTPQEIIDEESHPGILHDVLNSSSSSSSSDTSSDSDSDGSHTTAKRIKRAFRRTRRKSSASFKDTPSLPSLASSPSAEKDHAATSRPTSRRTSTLNPVLSGDEADGEDAQAGNSVARDFETGISSPPPERKSKRHSRKHRHRKYRTESQGTSEPQDVVPGRDVSPVVEEAHDAAPKVGFADQQATDDAEEKKLEAQREKVASRNPFNMRAMRPPMPKMLSQNVFTNAAGPSGSPNLGPRPTSTRTVTMGPRRVRSLPDNVRNMQSLSNVPSRTNPAPLSRPATRGLVPTAAAAMKEDRADDNQPEEENMSRTAAVMLLLISTGLVAFCAELMVDAIPQMTDSSAVSQTFIGLIILPIVGNAAEHVTAVTVAAKNKMDLAIGVAVGSSIQIALFVTPVVILLGWCMSKEMTLYFNLFETVSLFVTAFVINFLILDGRSNYLEGALLMGAYVIIAVAAFFYPDGDAQSDLGGNGIEDSSDAAQRMLMMMFRS
jgi:Ca2+:H+ antiporter